jgi:hypothetical protein
MTTSKSHKQQVLEILKDGWPHRTDMITAKMFGTSDTARTGLFRLGARIADLKQDGYNIKSYRDDDYKALWWYILIDEKPKLNQERFL